MITIIDVSASAVTLQPERTDHEVAIPPALWTQALQIFISPETAHYSEGVTPTHPPPGGLDQGGPKGLDRSK